MPSKVPIDIYKRICGVEGEKCDFNITLTDDEIAFSKQYLGIESDHLAL